MKHALLPILGILVAGISPTKAPPPNEHPVVKLDATLDSFLSPDARLEAVKSGFGFVEGTNWVQKGKTGYLVFSDTPANVIYKMTADGHTSVLVDHAGYDGPWNGYTLMTVGVVSNNGKDPNDPSYRQFIEIGSDGISLDPRGRLIVCSYAGRSLLRIEKNGRSTVLADRYEGKRLGGLNDVVVKRDGAIYFSDTFGGMRGRANDPAKELDYQAIYMLKNGILTLAVKDIPTPNGFAFSPDEKYFYANGSSANYIRRYEVEPDDTLKNGTLFIDMSADKTVGITDGMRVDSKGTIYSTGPGGIWIITPEGKHIGTILVPERAANVTFGDADWKSLYIAARTTIYRIRVNTPGIPCLSCSTK